MSSNGKFRIERDSLGPVEVPVEAYYGAETTRAVANFKISGIRPHLEFIRATALVKKAAAQANTTLGFLDKKAWRGDS